MNEITMPMRNTKTGVIENKKISNDNSSIALEALEQFSYSYKKNLIEVEKNPRFKNLVFFYDNPMGQAQRYTFGLVDPKSKRKIMGVAVCVLDKPYPAQGCENDMGLQFDLGYAIKEKYRGRGLSNTFLKYVSEYMFEIITMGKKNREIRFEMKVDVNNLASNATAKKLANIEDPYIDQAEPSDSVNFYYWQKRS